MTVTRNVLSGIALFTILLVYCGKFPVAECKQTRSMSSSDAVSTTSPEGTTSESQVVGLIPLVPTLKLGIMSAFSSLFLPGLHLTLTFITIIFSLVGIMSFLCPVIDCQALFREDDVPPHGLPQIAKFRHPMLQQFPPNKVKIWEERIPNIIHSLENSYVKYKDARKDE